MRRTMFVWATLCALSFMWAAQVRAAAEITIKGRLAHTVEAGGWLVVTSKEKYLLLNAERWRNESWFTTDAEVEATGEVRAGPMTISMEGTPFEARSLRPFGAGAQARQAHASAPKLTRVLASGGALLAGRPGPALPAVARTPPA